MTDDQGVADAQLLRGGRPRGEGPSENGRTRVLQRCRVALPANDTGDEIRIHV
jgi:hypothetical protein